MHLIGGNYTLAPVKTDDYQNGITTLDVIYIVRHILGIDILNSSYKIISADINADNQVDIFDVIELRMLILGCKSDFGTNKPWRFIPKDYKFKYPQNPLFESFPESITVTDLQNDQEHLDFVGVKIGDLNNSVTSTELATTSVRNFENTTIEFLNKKIHKEEAFSMDYTFLESDKILGFQLGLEYQDDLVCDVKVRLDNEGVKQNKFVKINEDNSRIKFSWNKENGRASFDDQPLVLLSQGLQKKILMHRNFLGYQIGYVLQRLTTAIWK